MKTKKSIHADKLVEMFKLLGFEEKQAKLAALATSIEISKHAYPMSKSDYQRARNVLLTDIFPENSQEKHDALERGVDLPNLMYDQDFSEELAWKQVRLKTPEDPYYDGKLSAGVVLHDGNLMINGVLFLKSQYEIIDNVAHD
jgi:hypothetical protein